MRSPQRAEDARDGRACMGFGVVAGLAAAAGAAVQSSLLVAAALAIGTVLIMVGASLILAPRAWRTMERSSAPVEPAPAAPHPSDVTAAAGAPRFSRS